MNFSNEELYSMYGQYDSFVRIDFHAKSESYDKFGASLMGVFKYTQESRDDLEAVLKTDEIPRSETNVLFSPSDLEKLTDEQKEDLDKNGILCSDIYSVSSVNLPKTNRYSESKKKEIPNTINIEIDSAGWNDLNSINYGFLKTRYLKDKNLSPNEFAKYCGLRNYYSDNVDNDFKELCYNDDKTTIRDEYKIHELKAKLFDLKISDDEMLDYIILVSEEIKKKDKLIKKELNRTNERLRELAEKYGDEIKNIEKLCHSFEEEVLLYGEKIIYLDIERFLHVYIRHVAETQISDKFSGKTVFQYQYDDIMRLISAVLSSFSNEIQEHFKNTPDSAFKRIGKRSLYFDGHYYRVEIEPSGRLLTFHPYNNSEEKDADTD